MRRCERLYLLVCVVFIAQSEVILLQEVEMFAHFDKEDDALCTFLGKQKR